MLRCVKCVGLTPMPLVIVPKGVTAYQARHSLRYYGRNEFAAVPLHDNVIRLLMKSTGSALESGQN